MKKLTAYIALLILPALAGAFLGYFLGQYLSNFNATVSLAKEIRAVPEFAAKGGKINTDRLSIDAKEFEKTPGAADPQFLYEKAAELKRKFGLGGILAGAWLGIVFFLKAVNAGRGRKYEIREPDPALCVSCARCFKSCPVERERLKKTND